MTLKTFKELYHERVGIQESKGHSSLAQVYHIGTGNLNLKNSCYLMHLRPHMVKDTYFIYSVFVTENIRSWTFIDQ